MDVCGRGEDASERRLNVKRSYFGPSFNVTLFESKGKTTYDLINETASAHFSIHEQLNHHPDYSDQSTSVI